MNEIKCPHCHKAFKVDEAGFAAIVKQVRDHQFEEELKDRLLLAEKEKASAVQLAEANVKNALQQELAAKDKQLSELKAQSESELSAKINAKESELLALKSTIAQAETAKQLAVSEATKAVERELADKARQLSEQKASIERDLAAKLTEKETQLLSLKSQIDQAATEKQLAVNEATRGIEKERDNLVNELRIKETEKQLMAKSIEEQYNHKLTNKEEALKLKDEEIARLKDYKQKLSTKMVGESLEQHCEIEFNKLRPTAFQNAYFEKDNDASGGTKGDFIYREMDDAGNEIISIMFEMKNENETTATKKRNEDFFAKLDKDRSSKNCEYAVLVSLLEADNEYYNNGIVDVSYRHEKMYVIRPQFFIPIITLLRNAAMNTLKYKQELNLVRNQNIDVTKFEDKITKFREGFAKNYISASTHFENAIKEIDNSIKKMEKVKQELRTSANQLRLANDKAEGLTIKKLTYGNPTMKAQFDEVREE